MGQEILQKEWLNENEASEYLGLPVDEVKFLAKNGYLGHSKLSSTIRMYKPEQLDNFDYREAIEKQKIKDIETNYSNKKEKDTDNFKGLVYFVGTYQDEYWHPSLKLPTCLVKIGWTVDIKNRFGTIKTYCPHDIALLAKIEAKTIKKEKELHKSFSEQRLTGEWFWYKTNVSCPIYRCIQDNRIKGSADRKRIFRKWSA